MTRQYVPHAVTGEPVPVATPEEQAAAKAEKDAHPWVYVTAWRCHCGQEVTFSAWLGIHDRIDASCARGHRNIIRFLPETFGGGA